MFMFNGGFASCARTIRAAKVGAGGWGLGTWGGVPVRVDSTGNTEINPGGGWQSAGSTGRGSLSDRCYAGDTAACNQWKHQSENASRQYQQMYPPGWNR
jgi:hypothetical protein